MGNAYIYLLKNQYFPLASAAPNELLSLRMKRVATAATSLFRFPHTVAGGVRSLAAKWLPGAGSRGRKKRVLLVDDEPALTMVCRLMLEKTDSFVVEEENLGIRAFSTARKFRPDVIFLDLCLPDKDGRAIAAELQNDPKLRTVPIVFWSGSFQKKRKAFTHSHGSWPALPKPFSNEELTQLAINPIHQ